MRIKLLAFLLVGTAAAGAFLGWATSGPASAQQEGAAPPPTEVVIQVIEPKAVSFSKDLPGRTVPFRIAEIRPQVNGIITKRLFEEGSDVKEGQQLYQIDPSVYQAAYDSAQADLMKAEANAKSVIARGERYKELVDIGGISKQEYDDAEASVAQARADIAIAKANVASAKINLDFTKMFSPISGRIGRSLLTEGALATQNQAAPLATVQQLDPIYVDVTQSSAELLKLRRDLAAKGSAPLKLPVELFVEGDTQPLEQKGELQFSDVSVDETTGSVQLRVLFKNPNNELLPGMFVRARISQSQDDAAVLVSQKAVTRNPDGSAVVMLVGEGNKVQPQPITATEAVGDEWLVTEGLKQGDRVIVEGTMKVQPGAVVKPVEAKKGEEASKASPHPEPAKE
ncbi:MAG: efflux transporter periplasmic adaptor subunit [Micavibrio aeruginosavorus]|uniref:Efflux transporter periplasmic adaptor subunit n=1 Tax=Micavibrio aeruginosavorus TaxID=349221 RepID=A0A2W5HMF9_9BACT|nr:MAG: efflux transporter periplasmic adaptor subunit [Micavibrio aeruginosavorus]